MNITFLIFSLSGGGAERVTIQLAEGLADRGHQVTLMTICDRTEDSYIVPTEVGRVIADPSVRESYRWFDWRRNLKKINALHKSLLEAAPDLVIAVMGGTGIWALKALKGTGIPVIISEHTDTRFLRENWRWNLLRWREYPKAAAVTVLNDEIAKWGERFWPKWSVSVIPNPVIPPEFSFSEDRPDWYGAKNLVGMGRLIEIKGFDLLVKAFALVADRFPEWNLTILGEGVKRSELERTIENYGLGNRAFLPGHIKSPFSIMAQADIFVLSSRIEGFGMALAEAMACGLPVISFDCPSGPSHIIRDGIDGLLVQPENPEALADGLALLMKDADLRQCFKDRAPEVTRRFGLSRILDQWESLICQAVDDWSRL